MRFFDKNDGPKVIKVLRRLWNGAEEIVLEEPYTTRRYRELLVQYMSPWWDEERQCWVYPDTFVILE